MDLRRTFGLGPSLEPRQANKVMAGSSAGAAGAAFGAFGAYYYTGKLVNRRIPESNDTNASAGLGPTVLIIP